LGAQQLRYTSIDDYTDSDHKPVIAEFFIQVLSNTRPLPVLFEPVGRWNQFCDNKISYTITSDFPISTRDWIGLYKSTYKHCRDYVTYVWASDKGDDVNDGTFMYTVTFGEEYLHRLEPGGYYLIYNSAAKNTAVGYSDLLQLSTSDEESSSSDSDDIDLNEAETTEENQSSSAGSKKEL
jgi:inositol-1,4,5-trisphosphate 5-phosphatase